MSHDSPGAKRLAADMRAGREARVRQEHAEREAQQRRASQPGRQVLQTEDGGEVPVAISATAEARLTRLANAKDAIGFRQMFLSGQAFAVQSGTDVLVIDRGFLTSEVRILAGPHAGKSGFVPSDFLK